MNHALLIPRRRAGLPAETNISFEYNDSALVYAGPWVLSGGDFFTWGFAGGNNGLDFAATGTRLELQLRGDTAWKLIVDGVTTTPTVGAAYTTVVAFDGAHATRQVSLRNVDSGRVKVSGFAVLYGQPPSIAKATNFGTAYPVLDTTNSVDNRGFIKHDNSLRIEADIGGGYAGYPAMASCTGGYLRFKATTTAIKLWVYNPDGVSVRLSVDGVIQGSAQTSASTYAHDYLTWTGLDGNAEHEYRVIVENHQPASFYPWGLSIAGTMNTGALAAPAKKVAFYGDSITAGTGTSTAAGFAMQTLLSLSYGGRIAGLDFRTIRDYGTGAGEASGDQSGELDVTRSVTNFGTDFDTVVVLLGTNDASEVFAAFNAANVQSSYTAMLTAIASAHGSAKVRCLGILNSSHSAVSANRTACNAAISAAVTAAADADITYHSTNGWIDPATDTTDGIHLNAAGNAKMVTQVSAILP